MTSRSSDRTIGKRNVCNSTFLRVLCHGSSLRGPGVRLGRGRLPTAHEIFFRGLHTQVVEKTRLVSEHLKWPAASHQDLPKPDRIWFLSEFRGWRVHCAVRFEFRIIRENLPCARAAQRRFLELARVQGQQTLNDGRP